MALLSVAVLLRPYTRPNVGNGLWLALLLPLALLVNVARHPVGRDYQTITCLAWMILAAQILTLWMFSETNGFPKRIKLIFYFVIIGVITSCAVGIVIRQSYLVAAFSLVMTSLTEWMYSNLLNQLPMTFTLGEAAVVSQAFALFLFNSLAIDLPNGLLRRNNQDQDCQEIDIITIVQLGVLLIFILIGFMRVTRKRSKLNVFLPLLAFIVLGIIIIPVTHPIPILFVWEFLFGHWHNFVVVIIFGLLLLMTGGICRFQVMSDIHASTTTRKYFHFLIVIVFLIGLPYQRLLLLFCAGVSFAIFVLLEAIRVGQVNFFSPMLEKIVASFADGQDSGMICLTPIYLLVGCAAPLFLSPVELSGSPESILPFMSGVLSIGIGDSVASIVGSHFGRNYWGEQERDKTIEGTVANALTQLVVIGELTLFGYIAPWTTVCPYIFCFLGVITNAIIEAKTDQIDNLVVPLVAYIFFSMV